MLFSPRIVPVLTALAGTTLSESAKLVALALTGSQGLADASGSLTRELVSALTQQTSSVERKIDRMLREPIATGLRLLSQALRHEPATEQEHGARDALLDGAHLSFMKALEYGGDLTEDAALVQGLDCIALKHRRGHGALSESSFADFVARLDVLRARVTTLEQESAEFTQHVETLRRYFIGDRNRPKPWGYAEQKALYLGRKRQADALAVRVAQARKKLDILETIALIAQPAPRRRD
jgi:hypothetical protein